MCDMCPIILENNFALSRLFKSVKKRNSCFPALSRNSRLVFLNKFPTNPIKKNTSFLEVELQRIGQDWTDFDPLWLSNELPIPM